MVKSKRTGIGLAVIAAALSVAAPVHGAPARAGIEELTPKTFGKEVLNNEKPAVVMFYTDGCPYCRMMQPIFEDVCSDMRNEIYCAAYNTEQENDTLSQTYHIDGVPAFGFFYEGETDRARWIGGAVPESVLRQRIRSFARSHTAD
ncbi:MAG: thioredoxin family protein [Nanoarchaeota archaeon]|nr:thioredoxin family protein [Nanoarchaeota archaeon]